MALENREGGQYFTILNGKFCQRVPAETAGAIQRTNKNNKVVFEKFYDKFVGKFVSIATKDSAYGKSWVFAFKDQKEVYHLQLNYSNSFAVALLKMLPNIDLSKPMTVSPSQKIEDGKTKSSLFIQQDGVNIKHAFTKDNPNGLPQMKQIKVKGQMVWDDTDRMLFLENMVNSKIRPQLTEKVSALPAEGSDLNVDDMPDAKDDNEF